MDIRHGMCEISASSHSCDHFHINCVISDTAQSLKNLAIHLAESSRMSSRPLFFRERKKGMN